MDGFAVDGGLSADWNEGKRKDGVSVASRSSKVRQKRWSAQTFHVSATFSALFFVAVSSDSGGNRHTNQALRGEGK